MLTRKRKGDQEGDHEEEGSDERDVDQYEGVPALEFPQVDFEQKFQIDDKDDWREMFI